MNSSFENMSRRQAACVLSFVVLGAITQQPATLTQFAAAIQVATVPVFVYRDLKRRIKNSIEQRKQHAQQQQSLS
jgi:hypothetical protein